MPACYRLGGAPGWSQCSAVPGEAGQSAGCAAAFERRSSPTRRELKLFIKPAVLTGGQWERHLLYFFFLLFACAYLHLINAVWRGIRCCTWPWRDVGVKILSPPRRKLERPWIAFCCPDGFTDTKVRILLPWWLIEVFSTRRVKLTPIQSVVICTSHRPLWRGNMKVGEPKIKCCVSWPACNLSSLFNDLEDNENEWSVLKQILFNWSSAPLSRWCQTRSAVFSGFCLFYGPRVVCSLRLFWFSFCGHVLIR